MISLPDYTDNFEAFNSQGKTLTLKDLNKKSEKFYNDNKLTKGHSIFITGNPNSPFAFCAGLNNIYLGVLNTLQNSNFSVYTGNLPLSSVSSILKFYSEAVIVIDADQKESELVIY